MKKVTLLAAMLAMVMVAAAPALAQSTAVGGSVQIQNQYSPQEINQSATATQSNTGGGTGAAISQNLGIDQSAANISAQAGDDINVGTSDDGVSDGVFGDDGSGVAVAGDGATAVGGDVQIQSQFCPQVITQYANADQANTGGGIGAGIAQNLGISQEAVNACLQAGGDINLGSDSGEEVVVVHEDDGTAAYADDDDVASSDDSDDGSGSASGSAASTSSGSSEDSGSSEGSESSEGGSSEGSVASESGVASAVYGALPDTGGFSLLALGAGVLLLGGGLVARRMFR